MLAVAGAGDPFPAVFAELTRVFATLDEIGRQDWKRPPS
jgi:hypothetical protein